jgi:hypothetical protein
MSRIRLINPAGPKDEAVASCSLAAQHAWVYLPCHADRAGRLEDKPITLRFEIFPASPSVDMDALLAELAAVNLIRRYQVDGKRYIAIRTFARHQRPHRNEAPSTIPGPPEGSCLGPSETDHGTPLPEPVEPTPEPVGLFPSTRAVPDPVSDPVPDPVRTDPETRVRDPAAAVPATGGVWMSAPVPAGMRAQLLIDLFGRIRSETIRGALPWRTAGGNLFNRAVAFVRDIEDDPEAQADIEETMRMALRRAKDANDPQQTEPAFAFGTWVSKFTPLREELRGLRQPVGTADKPCAFHAGTRNVGKLPRKHEIRLECAECKHLAIRDGPRPESRAQSAAEMWEPGR